MLERLITKFQVNGVSIHSRLDAIKQFHSNYNETSILLARTIEVLYKILQICHKIAKDFSFILFFSR